MEIEIMTDYILSKPLNDYTLYSFDSNAYYYGNVNILIDEGYVNLPNFKPGSSTNTCRVLNLKLFKQYECWCLSNVLSRPLYDSTTNYWLNPVSAGVETCIKVHNLKAKGISKLLGINDISNFDENLNMIQIINNIKLDVDKYNNYLLTFNLDEQIEKNILSNIQF